MAKAKLVECSFYVPLVRDSDRRPHSNAVWADLDDALDREFEGSTGPELVPDRRPRVVHPEGVYRAIRNVRGSWRSSAGSRIEDESMRYIVAVERSRVRVLRRVLAWAARAFDQQAIYLSVGGAVEFVEAEADDGDAEE